MGYELICADSDFREIGSIMEFISFNAVISMTPDCESNDFMLEMPVAAWKSMPVEVGGYVYIPGTEWGGPVERIRHSSQDDTVKIYGTVWRGLLARRVICPPSGLTHLVFSGEDANYALSRLFVGWRSELFSVSNSVSGISLYGSIRYRPLLEAIYTLLEGAGSRLSLSFSDGKVYLSCERVSDKSDAVELSQDYETRITSDFSLGAYNHIIALGQGEMLDRTVVELWRLPGGEVTDDPLDPDIPDAQSISTLLYDYPSVESEDELVSAATKKLLGQSDQGKLEIELYDAGDELSLTDIVSVRDSVTGMTGQLRVVEKELSITQNKISVKHTLG